MAPPRHPISVRTTRLNNIILGKNSIPSKQNGKRFSVSAANVGGGGIVSKAVTEILHRESILDAFLLLYEECNKDALKKRDRNIAEFVNKYRDVIEETKDMRVNANDFNVKALIGKGYFGNVHLVVERPTNDVYAMKIIKKSVVTTSQVKEERDIMAQHSSEWITNLQYAFQDSENLYLVMEFLPGGDLLSLMTRHGPFDEGLARFYLAELTAAIHSLHSMGYVHRDIKPENILIDRFGHIKLGDFGNAAALDKDGHVFSLSPVGTPDYIAPELLQTISTYKLTKSLHDVSCDFWSMGIIGYEMVCETTPFHEDNVHETYSRILSHCEDSHLKEIITFPKELKISTEFSDLIQSLVTNPTNRLGYDKITKHAYFNGIKWDQLRLQVPPIIPTVNGEDDTSNFEDVVRNKARPGTYAKKAATTTNVKTNDFSGKDLPFIGYSYVYMDRSPLGDQCGCADETRIGKLNGKMMLLQMKLKDREAEVARLKTQFEKFQDTRNTTVGIQAKAIQEAKEDFKLMTETFKEKVEECAEYRAQVTKLQATLKVEREMQEKKDAQVMELLEINRLKYLQATMETEKRYERMLGEKQMELLDFTEKLEARESELMIKNDECKHLQEKMENYKEILQQFKEQAQINKAEFEKNKKQIAESYEKQLNDLRAKLSEEKDSKSRLTMHLQDVCKELDESVSSIETTKSVKAATAKSNDEIMKRLNQEIADNNKLHETNAQLEQKLTESQKIIQELQQDVNRLERELKVAECSKNLVEAALSNHTSPFETAPGSLTELHATEEQLRADLQAAKEKEEEQKERADKLQELVVKLEAMLEKFEHSGSTPTKATAPHPAPRHVPTSVGDMLEKQNEKLEDKLAAVREEMIVERQAARTANLALWKVEKKLDEALTEKRMMQRRLDLTEERIKKIQTERENAERMCKQAQEETRQREERIQELKQEIAAIKHDVMKEHKMWEKSEQERMNAKSELIEYISNINKLEQNLSEVRQKLQQSQRKCDQLSMENKRLTRELSEEREGHSTANETVSRLNLELKNLHDNYARLKYACTITDNQLTEVENMLSVEQQRNKMHQEKIDKLYLSLREKDDILKELRKELRKAGEEQDSADARIQSLMEDSKQQMLRIEEQQKKQLSQEKQLLEQTRELSATYKQVEFLTLETNQLKQQNDNLEHELTSIKEDYTRILSELFHAKEEAQNYNAQLSEALTNAEDLRAEIEELQSILTEKESFYLQRDIKSEATLAQHKKLIDYLQLKVEDLSQKKKKTLADKLFGTHSTAAKKENISPAAVEESILYRALQAELKREKQLNKTLQEKLDKATGNQKNTSVSLPSSPIKTTAEEHEILKCITAEKSPQKRNSSRTSEHKKVVKMLSHKEQPQQQQQSHRFELALQESNIEAQNCIACEKPIIGGSAYWSCKECKTVAHRKCRSEVKVACGHSNETPAKEPNAPEISETESQADAASLGQYSYEAKLDTVDVINTDYNGSLIFNVERGENSYESLEVNCGYEIEEKKILLLGCNSGLYAYHINTQCLVHIAGLDSVSYIAISEPLAKAVLVGSRGESLYQCDFRQLLSRSQASSCLKPALEASMLDLPLSKRVPNEKWQLVKISNESENALDSVAIAATSSRIVIMKYDLKMQKFKPVRALDTATSVTSILYTRHTAIVSSDKFFEIDLSTFSAEEFVDLSDQSLSHTSSCQPVISIRISPQEFLLCFMECGVFVDEFGCRSRPYDINWEYTPTGFLYREPFLYVAHFQSVQVLRLHRSYTNEVNAQENSNSSAEQQQQQQQALKRVFLPFYMPTLLAESGKLNAYTLAIVKDSGLQQIHHIDALQAFKHKLNISEETISSIATSITIGSATTTDAT